MSEQTQTLTPVIEPVLQLPPYGMDYRTWFEYKAKLAKKKLAVMNAVDTIPKNGYNQEDDFYFSRESDINDMLRKLLYNNQLAFDIEYLDRVYRDNGKIVEVKLLVTWTDTDTGYFESRKWLGTGFDYVEKGVYKAYTGGTKYFFMRTFLMSQGDTDPEYTKGGSREKPKQPETPQTAAQGGTLPEADKKKETTQEPTQKATASRTRAEQKDDKEKAEKEAKAAADKAAQEAAQAEKDKAEAEGQKKQDEAAEGSTGATEPADAADAPITSEQVGKVKAKVLTLAAFSDEKNKKSAQDAVYNSLTIKPELRAWGERIKGKTQAQMIEAFTTSEAAKAIEYLDGWVKMKEKAKGGN